MFLSAVLLRAPFRTVYAEHFKEDDLDPEEESKLRENPLDMFQYLYRKYIPLSEEITKEVGISWK